MTGIDITAKYDDIRRLFYWRLNRRWSKLLEDVDTEDLFQKLLLSLVVRNAGEHPYTPSRGGIPYYICMVTDSICSHACRRKRLDHQHGEMTGAEADFALSVGVSTPGLGERETYELLGRLWRTGALREGTLERLKGDELRAWEARRRERRKAAVRPS
ncbi:MAG: hypothetical protein Q8P18_18295 [Pseudomonadota bacterium]|nr:hypothetical protein [Pseudomonadota bacterium]